MGKPKKKIVADKEESDFKSKHGRIPVARPSQYFRDKSKYYRKVKHKNRSQSPDGAGPHPGLNKMLKPVFV